MWAGYDSNIGPVSVEYVRTDPKEAFASVYRQSFDAYISALMRGKLDPDTPMFIHDSSECSD